MKASRPAGIISAWPLLVLLTLRENRAKYKRSILGWAWSMINPIATMLVFTFVFRVVLKITPPLGDPSGLNSFPLFLLAALLPWNFLSTGLTSCIGTVVGNAGLIKKVYFPRSVLPAATVFSADTNLLIELGVLVVVLGFFGQNALIFLPVIILVIVLLTMFVMGVGMALGALNVYFRDIEHFINILLLMWFYATPVIYPESLVPEAHLLGGFRIPVRSIYELNPMVHFTQAFRALFYDLRMPTAASFVYMFVSATVSMLAGFAIFKRLEPRFAEEL